MSEAAAANEMTESEREIDRLKAELEHFQSSGIIEVAVRNPSVKDYMDHWEGRATKAEAEVQRLTSRDPCPDTLANRADSAMEMIAEIERLREALSEYAQIKNWLANARFDPDSPRFDGVEFARAALGDSHD